MAEFALSTTPTHLFMMGLQGRVCTWQLLHEGVPVGAFITPEIAHRAVTACNEHEALKAENERLRAELDHHLWLEQEEAKVLVENGIDWGFYFWDGWLGVVNERDELRVENERLREALKNQEPLPGDTIAEAHCPCCGAELTIEHGDEDGEIAALGAGGIVQRLAEERDHARQMWAHVCDLLAETEKQLKAALRGDTDD